MADCKKYNGSTWQHSLRKLDTTTDTITTLPAEVYPNDTTATVGLKGQAVQSGTPTPDNPIMPQGCGDLETVGAKAGQYKIPISSANTTTPIYLGEVETTRRVKKLVLTGEETIIGDSAYNRFLFTIPDIRNEGIRLTKLFCTHYQNIADGRPIANVPNYSIYTGGGADSQKVFIKTTDYTTVADFRAYLQQQYAAGTPVCVWYVLTTPETAVVNEPLMKIGEYVDSVSAITIPTITGKDTFDVETTLKPSEVELTYTGWHDASVKEKSRNLFDYQTMAISAENSYLNSDGTVGASSIWDISDYVPCDGTVFAIGNVGGNTPAFCLYDENKQYITGKSYNTGGASSKQAINITSQSTAKYIRFSYCKASGASYDDLSAIMLNSGSTAFPYEPYWK